MEPKKSASTNITQTYLRKLPRPEQGTFWVFDTEQRGFQLAHGKRSSHFPVHIFANVDELPS